MIRFIYIKDQICEGETSFAFFDTITGKFISFEDQQVFDDVDEFISYFNNPKGISRFLRLIPVEFFKGTPKLELYYGDGIAGRTYTLCLNNEYISLGTNGGGDDDQNKAFETAKLILIERFGQDFGLENKFRRDGTM